MITENVILWLISGALIGYVIVRTLETDLLTSILVVLFSAVAMPISLLMLVFMFVVSRLHNA